MRAPAAAEHQPDPQPGAEGLWPRRLTLVSASLTGGGAERVLVRLANEWARAGRAVTVLTLDGAADGQGAPLHAAIERQHLAMAEESRGRLHALTNNLARVRALRRAVSATRPDLVLSFIDSTNVLTLIATAGIGVPVLVAERSEPSLMPLGRVWAVLRRLTYRRAALVIVQTEAAGRYFATWRGVVTAVVPNPVPRLPPRAERDHSATSERWLIAVGRLSAEKRFDLLVDAFARLAPGHPGWRLCIVGDGPLREPLARQVTARGLGARVHLAGARDDVVDLLRRADLFALTSTFEGFPNALCEAMAVGLPVVAFDCPSGPRAIIRHGIDGLLVPAGDLDALAQTLGSLMRDPAARSRLAARAPEVADRFAVAAVIGQWERLFRQVAARRSGVLSAPSSGCA